MTLFHTSCCSNKDRYKHKVYLQTAIQMRTHRGNSDCREGFSLDLHLGEDLDKPHIEARA
jgi:hypothetical protein